MQHAFVPSADSDGVDLMERQFSDVIEFDKVGISEHILFVLDVIPFRGVEGSTDGRSIAERDWFSELSTGFGVLIELCHFYNLNLYTKTSFEILFDFLFLFCLFSTYQCSRQLGTIINLHSNF